MDGALASEAELNSVLSRGRSFRRTMQVSEQSTPSGSPCGRRCRRSVSEYGVHDQRARSYTQVRLSCGAYLDACNGPRAASCNLVGARVSVPGGRQPGVSTRHDGLALDR